MNNAFENQLQNKSVPKEKPQKENFDFDHTLEKVSSEQFSNILSQKNLVKTEEIESYREQATDNTKKAEFLMSRAIKENIYPSKWSAENSDFRKFHFHKKLAKLYEKLTDTRLHMEPMEGDMVYFYDENKNQRFSRLGEYNKQEKAFAIGSRNPIYRKPEEIEKKEIADIRKEIQTIEELLFEEGDENSPAEISPFRDLTKMAEGDKMENVSAPKVDKDFVQRSQKIDMMQQGGEFNAYVPPVKKPSIFSRLKNIFTRKRSYEMDTPATPQEIDKMNEVYDNEIRGTSKRGKIETSSPKDTNPNASVGKSTRL